MRLTRLVLIAAATLLAPPAFGERPDRNEEKTKEKSEQTNKAESPTATPTSTPTGTPAAPESKEGVKRRALNGDAPSSGPVRVKPGAIRGFDPQPDPPAAAPGDASLLENARRKLATDAADLVPAVRLKVRGGTILVEGATSPVNQDRIRKSFQTLPGMKGLEFQPLGGPRSPDRQMN